MEFGFELFLIAGLISFFSAFIHGSIGLGFPMVATPLLAIFIDIQTAIILTLLPSLLTNSISIKSEGNIALAARRYLSLAIFVMSGSAIGTQILIFTNAEIFKALLAAAILMYLFAEKVNFKLGWVLEHQRFSNVVFGISAGILGGLTNVMAPVLIIYTLESKYSKSETIQALNFCFLFGKITQLVIFTVNSQLTFREFSASSVMFLTAAIALFFGLNIRKKIKVNTYRKILRLVLLILAVILFYQVYKVT